MLLSSNFKGSKCKTLLRLCVGRIKLLRNKRALAVKELRKGISELLRTNQEAAATIRVEHVFREEAVMGAYDGLELFCEQVSVRIQMIEASRECPSDLKEAISSLMFAAPRCPDLPELMQVRSLFASKYGKEFVQAASELMANCGVNRQLIGKLSTHPPSGQLKIELLKKIAEEYSVSWDPEKLQKTLCGADPDLLKGGHSFLSPLSPPEQGGIPATADSSRKGGDVTEVGRGATESGTTTTESKRSGRVSIFATSFTSKPAQPETTDQSPQANPRGSQANFPTLQDFPPAPQGFSPGSQLYPPDIVLSSPSAHSLSDPQQGASASRPFSPQRLQGSVQEKPSTTGSTTRSPITSFISPVIPAPDSMQRIAAETVVGVHHPNVPQRNPIVPFPSPVLPSGGRKQTATSEPKSSNSQLGDLLWSGERPRAFEHHGEERGSEVPKEHATTGDLKSSKHWIEVGWTEGRPPVLEFYKEEGKVKSSQQMRGQGGSGTDRTGMWQHHGKDGDGVKKESGQQSESLDDNDNGWRKLLQEKIVGREDGESSDEDYTDVAAAAAAALTAAERAASAARAAARLAFRLGEQSMIDGRGSERKVTKARRSAGQASLHPRDCDHPDQADERSKGRTKVGGRMGRKEDPLVMEHLGQDELTIDEGTGSSGQDACSEGQQPGDELGGDQVIFCQGGWHARSSHGLVEGTKDQDTRARRGVPPPSRNPTTMRSGLDKNKSVEQDGLPGEFLGRIMRQPSPERAAASQEGVHENILQSAAHGPGSAMAARQPTNQGMHKMEMQQSDDPGKEMTEARRPTIRSTHGWDDGDDDSEGHTGGRKMSATRKKNAEDRSEEFDDLDFPSPPTAPVIFKPS